MATQSETCKCRYKHCLHGDDKQLLKSEAVKVGNQYYHQDCFNAKKTIDEIIDYFTKEINPDVVYPVLVRTINNLVYPKDKEGISPERLLFQLKYHCTHGNTIRHPGGLYYAVQNRDAYEAYVKQKSKERIGNYDFSVKDDLVENQFKKMNIKKQKGFEDILGG